MAFVTPTYILVWFYGQNVVTVCGNLIILLAIYRDRRLRSNNDVLVANLGKRLAGIALSIKPKRESGVENGFFRCSEHPNLSFWRAEEQ